MNLSAVSKAIAGALVAALVGLAARYGFHADKTVVDAVDVIVTTIVSGVVGYLGVYFAPKNK